MLSRQSVILKVGKFHQLLNIHLRESFRSSRRKLEFPRFSGIGTAPAIIPASAARAAEQIKTKERP
jgi:hypothetical protein